MDLEPVSDGPRKVSAKDASGMDLEPVETSFMDSLAKEGGEAVDTFLGNAKAAADTASLGLLPRALAIGDAAVQTLERPSSPVENYEHSLTKRQTESRENAYQHPSASIVGGFLTPGAGELGAGWSAGQRIVAAGGMGALAGNLQAPHDSPGRAESTIAGGLGGMALQGAGELASPLSKYFSKGLRDYSGSQATNVAVGGKAGIGDRLRSAGIDPSEQAAFGNKLLDENLIPTGLHPTQSPVAGVLERARALKSSSGANVGREIQAAENSGTSFDPLAAQEEMSSRLGRLPLETGNSSKALGLIEQVGKLTPQGEYASGGGFSDANQTKSQAWKAANFKDDAPMQAQQYRKAVSGLRDSIRDQVGAANGPESANRLTQANQRFGLASTAEDISAPAVSRGGAAQQFGIPAAAAAALTSGLGVGQLAGGMAGGATAALVGGALLKSRGPAIAARLGRAGSNALNAVDTSQGPLATGAIADALRRYFGDDEEKKQDFLNSLKNGAP